MSLSPRLSVVIPTHNRSVMLARNLIALGEQTYPATGFEVVVVADSCQDDTAQVVLGLIGKVPYRLRFFSHSAMSASATRNLGAYHAEGKYLLFLDDDVLASPGLVQAHLQSQGKRRIVLGYSKPVIPAKASFWQYNARRWWEDTFRAMRSPGYRFSYRDFFSGNVSMPAELFRAVGGFDETIKVRLEDYELGMRLLKGGAQFFFCPQAIGFHLENSDLPLWLERVRKEGIANIQIGTRHAELRNILFAGFEQVDEQWGRTRWRIRQVAFDRPTWAERLAGLMLCLAFTCERLRLRSPWLHITGALREYHYWCGVAVTIGGLNQLRSWLQEAPLPPSIGEDAVCIDMEQWLSGEGFEETIAKASISGIRLSFHGKEILGIPARPGFEPLRLEHVQRALQELAENQFIPVVALELIRSKQVVGNYAS